MFTRKLLPDCPVTLELSVEELDILQDAMQAFILQPRHFTDPRLRELLTQLEKSRLRLSAADRCDRHRLESASQTSFEYPLFAWAEVCREATALPVKPEAGLAAKAAPQAMTVKAPRGNRAANPTKDITAKVP